jgi:hypothetical protein
MILPIVENFLSAADQVVQLGNDLLNVQKLFRRAQKHCFVADCIFRIGKQQSFSVQQTIELLLKSRLLEGRSE